MTPDLPPPQFDHVYSGRMVIIEWVEPADIHERCKIEGSVVAPMKSIMACSQSISADVCRVILPKDYGFARDFMDRLWRHEMGHCNGWRHP